MVLLLDYSALSLVLLFTTVTIAVASEVLFSGWRKQAILSKRKMRIAASITALMFIATLLIRVLND
jgi:hypothetical protein